MEYTYIHNHQSQFLEMFGNSEIIELGNVATFINGSAFKPEEWASDGLPIIRIQNLTDPSASYNYYSGTDAKVLIESGDVLVSWSATLDVYLWNQGKAVLNQHIFKVVFDKIGIDKDFFIYTVKSKLAEMVSKAHGSTMKHIVKKDFETTLVPYPSFEKQKEFASIVRQSDKSKFDGFKSQFLEMTRTADRHPIGQLCDIFGGATPARTNKEYWENGTCPWFTVEDLHNQGAHIWKTEQHITEAALKKVKKYPVDTVLLCCTSATIGSVAYSHIPLSSNQQFNGLVVKDRNKLRPEFLFYNCTLLKDELLKQCGKTTFAFVPRGTLEKIEIFCPDIHVQNQFVKVLEQADKSKYYVQNKQNYICHILTNQIQ